MNFDRLIYKIMWVYLLKLAGVAKEINTILGVQGLIVQV